MSLVRVTVSGFMFAGGKPYRAGTDTVRETDAVAPTSSTPESEKASEKPCGEDLSATVLENVWIVADPSVPTEKLFDVDPDPRNDPDQAS